jgi:hypothetical protein
MLHGIGRLRQSSGADRVTLEVKVPLLLYIRHLKGFTFTVPMFFIHPVESYAAASVSKLNN